MKRFFQNQNLKRSAIIRESVINDQSYFSVEVYREGKQNTSSCATDKRKAEVIVARALRTPIDNLKIRNIDEIMFTKNW